jgi:hypothetical protein
MSAKKKIPNHIPPTTTPVPDDRLTGPERGTAPKGKNRPKKADGSTKPYEIHTAEAILRLTNDLHSQYTEFSATRNRGLNSPE